MKECWKNGIDPDFQSGPHQAGNQGNVRPVHDLQIASPNDAQELAALHIANEDREVFLVMMLNTKNQAVGLHRAHTGSLNASMKY
ncbi:JAB domain-containing protein [Peribacillus butanolivorans]|uniref:JAB domain-containing protein n=1 Tax=Peribacillus butanolivorans TaxID=421767 RepID=UPI00362935CA